MEIALFHQRLDDALFLYMGKLYEEPNKELNEELKENNKKAHIMRMHFNMINFSMSSSNIVIMKNCLHQTF